MHDGACCDATWLSCRTVKRYPGNMPVLPLDELQFTEKDPLTGKITTLPALVIFDESLQKCLDSYLHYAPRKFDRRAELPVELNDLERHLHRNVFLTFLRMSTHKESKDHFITPSVFGEILYNNFLFDIPKILDLCVLFGKGNGSLLQKMIGNIFTQQSSYFNDLDEIVPTILQELKDIVLYVCDSCITLWAFLDVFPLACQTFQKQDFCFRLAAFYELVIPELESAIKKRHHENISCDSIQAYIEEFLQIFTSVLQETRFLRDYDELFPVADDVSLLQQASSALDETRTSYILQAVESAWDKTDRRKKAVQDPALTETAAGAITVSRVSEQMEHVEEEDHLECAGAAAAPVAPVSGVELDSLISQVKDLLPDLGEGFVLACLEEYNYNVEHVINNLLEGKLAVSLQTLDRAMPRPVKPDPTPLVSARCNVFQDDEFDVFSKDSVDISRIQKGKRSDKATTKSLVNDKRLVKEQRERYNQYSVIVEEVPEPSGCDLFSREDYEDEYDDTYDGNQVGANDADSDDELISRRPFTIPQVLRPKEEKEQEDDDDEEETEEKEVAKDHFVQDPAVLRERAEARRMTFLARKGPKPDNSAAVVGSAKGRGQNRDTVQERRKKEASKGTRANHNRRTMADRKRSKGMIPS
ncbi:hypothetical protein Chor_013018 [Crotalus horridus]